jgi:putative peptidoglycan lipid II flippase
VPEPEPPPGFQPPAIDPGATQEDTRAAATAQRGGARSAHWVAAGILSSRITGLVRERLFAHYFGTSLFADAFRGALRMPNVLQNLLGEGTLSASFIPIYSELIHRGRKEEAGRVAGAVFALLLAVAGAVALIGILLAPVLVSVFLAGFSGLQRDLAIDAVRIIFPMTGVLVLSAWSLGILNSHRRFFVPYVAPVLWNAAMIATLLFFGGRLPQRDLVIALSWGALLGGALQFAIQIPWVLSLERHLELGWGRGLEPVRLVVRNAGPAIMGRGAVQVSGWLEIFLASFLGAGAMASIGFAATLYILPVSLFGMSVAAAELPELARERGQVAEVLRQRVRAAMRQIAFFAIPSLVGYLVLGDIIVAALYEGGEFGRDDTVFVYAVLAAMSLGLIASTGTRLYSSTFFALRDTRTPARIALIRLVVMGAIGASIMFPLERYTLRGHGLGAIGLALAGALAAWVEWYLLRRVLTRRVGAVALDAGHWAVIVPAAIAAAAVARGVSWVLPPLHPILVAVVVLVPFGIVYFGITGLFGVGEASRVLRRFRPG